MREAWMKLRHLWTGVLGLAAACGQPAGFRNARGEEAERLARDPAVLVLDVRTPGENAEARLERSILIPVHELESRLGELPDEKSRTVLVYCAAGGRSARAAALLASRGWRSVVNLEGGIQAWRAEGRPVLR